MDSRLEPHFTAIRDARERLLQSLEGMDYCLDWKPDPSVWSARQVVYHLLDPPPGGLASVVEGIISGGLTEYDLWADLDNVTPERQEFDLERVLKDIDEFFSRLSETLSAASVQDLTEKRAMVHNISRGSDDERTAGEILERGISGHWAAHFEQLQELRDSLGV